MDTSSTDWGGYIQDLVALGSWAKEERNLHFSVLALRAVKYSLQAFLDVVKDKKVLLMMADNLTMLAYIKNQRDTWSETLFQEVQDLLQLMEDDIYSGETDCVGKCSQLEAQDMPREWSILLLWKVWGILSIDLFATM